MAIVFTKLEQMNTHASLRPCSCKQQLKMGGLLTTCIYFEEDETITHAHEDDSHEDEDDSHEDEDGLEQQGHLWQQ